MDLTDVLSSNALSRVVVHFLVHFDKRLHLRALQRHTGLSMYSLQRELAKLEEFGIVYREEKEGRVFYLPDLDDSRWNALRKLVQAFARPEEVLRDALEDFREHTDVVFLYGSAARGDMHEESDIDVFVVSDSLTHRDLAPSTMDAGVVLGREINVDIWRPSELAEPKVGASRYLRSVLNGARIPIFSEDDPSALIQT